MASFGLSFGARDVVELVADDITSRFPSFMVSVGSEGHYIHVHRRELDVAEQVAQRLLEGVAAMREELKRREQASVAETVG